MGDADGIKFQWTTAESQGSIPGDGTSGLVVWWEAREGSRSDEY